MNCIFLVLNFDLKLNCIYCFTANLILVWAGRFIKLKSKQSFLCKSCCCCYCCYFEITIILILKLWYLISKRIGSGDVTLAPNVTALVIKERVF